MNGFVVNSQYPLINYLGSDDITTITPITTKTIYENITTIITPTTTDAPIRYHPFKTSAFFRGEGSKIGQICDE